MYCYDNSKTQRRLKWAQISNTEMTGMFYKILPRHKWRQKAWEQMTEQSGSAVVLEIESKIIAQLRGLGFKVKKSESVKESDDDLLLALMS